MVALLTVGHGTASAEAFLELLQDAGVEEVVDVRRYPGSRRHPHFGADEMQRWLTAGGVGYRWAEDLGGRRRVPADSPDGALRNRAFQGYAAHMRTPEFRSALHDVLEVAARRKTAVMCSESVWWRCHRRLISDTAVLVHDVDVLHLMHDGRLTPHGVTDGARLDGGAVIYDVGLTPSLLDD